MIMNELINKRKRKSKLVPREFVDSDDESIAHMQEEIEANILKGQSLLKKLNASNLKKENRLLFSINIKVEKCDDEQCEVAGDDVTEDKTVDNKNDPPDVPCVVARSNKIVLNEDKAVPAVDTVKDTLNTGKKNQNSEQSKQKRNDDNSFRIESVRSHTPSSPNGYYVTNEMIQKELEIVSKQTTRHVDKLIEIHLNNYFGRELKAPEPDSKVDSDIQDALKKWKGWQNVNSIREAPQIFVCQLCRKAWWDLHSFREHLKTKHGRENPIIKFASKGHKSYVVALNHNQINIDSPLVDSASDCWRCGRNFMAHSCTLFKCKGCSRKFKTCLQMSTHEGVCKGNKMLYASTDNVDIEYNCPICSYKHWRKVEFHRHLIGMHSVRSDLPMPWSVKKCFKCKRCYHNHGLHECPEGPLKFSCKFCGRRYYSQHNLMLHYWNFPHSYVCQFCKKVLRKCMEAKHLLIHSDSFIFIYKCLVCKDSPCFLDKNARSFHIVDCSKNQNKSLFEKVIIPKTLHAKLLNQCSTNDRSKASSSSVNQNISDPKPNKDEVSGESQQNKENNETNGNMEVEVDLNATVIQKGNLQNPNVENEPLYEGVANIKSEALDEEEGRGEEVTDMPANEHLTIYRNENEPPNVYFETQYDSIKVESPIDIVLVENQDSNDGKIKNEPMDADEVNEYVNEGNEDCEMNDYCIKNEIDGDFVSAFTDYSLPIDYESKEGSERSQNSSEDSLHFTEVDEESIWKTTRKPTVTPADHQHYEGERKTQKRVCEKYTRMLQVQACYKCTKCDTSYEDFRHYLKHFTRHDYKPLTCPECVEECANATKLIDHVTLHIKYNFVCVHSICYKEEKNNFQCKQCKEMFRVSDFFIHWESHLSVRVREPECVDAVNMDKKPNLKEMINYLINTDKNSLLTKHNCKECDRRFGRKNDYKRHFIEHLLADAYREEPTYGILKCQICGAGFHNGDKYKRHLRDHASLPIYKCELCDKAFSDSSNFSKHKKVHNLSVLICNTCGKKFNNKITLVKHFEYHEKVKPIECGHCNKTFYSSSLFMKHLKFNKQRFPCKICNRTFVSVRDKMDHMWEVHEKRKFQADCTKCRAKFRKFADLKKHFKTVHSR